MCSLCTISFTRPCPSISLSVVVVFAAVVAAVVVVAAAAAAAAILLFLRYLWETGFLLA